LPPKQEAYQDLLAVIVLAAQIPPVFRENCDKWLSKKLTRRRYIQAVKQVLCNLVGSESGKILVFLNRFMR